MEFGIFVQGHVPKARVEREGRDAEHNALMADIECIKAADRYGWKYAWVSEHHFLTEYSHLSASDVFIGYCAAVTNRIHLGSGIFSFNPHKDHPGRIAERVAMLDHLSNGRFEFGTGRGAGSREVTGWDIESTELTRAIWDEVIREIPKMWRDEEYSYQGTSFNMPFPAIRSPPATCCPRCGSRRTRRCGWPPATRGTYVKAAQLGLGVLAFNVSAVKDMAPLVASYKDNIGNAEPVGDYVNDNVMITNGLVCLEDGQKAREAACNMGVSYLQSQVFYYHDTMPKAEGIPVWPEPFAEPTLEDIEYRIQEGYLLCGSPDEIVEQVARYQDVGIDQLVFGMPLDLPLEQALETIQLFGEHVIPQFDTSPTTFRSDGFRYGTA